jgi:hypothetical protein
MNIIFRATAKFKEKKTIQQVLNVLNPYLSFIDVRAAGDDLAAKQFVSLPYFSRSIVFTNDSLWQGFVNIEE